MLSKKYARLSIIIVGAAVLLLLLVGGYLLYQERERLVEEKEAFVALEKSKMEDELTELQAEYGLQVEKIRTGSGYGEQYMNLSSDSLLEQLGSQRAKIERLSEELKAVKAADAKRIGELSREVQTLRKVLKTYVSQVDSLQRLNTQLTEENRKVKSNMASVQAEAARLRTEKTTLTDQVARAARLEARDIRCLSLDKRGKKTRRIDRIQTVQIDLTIAKNITATPGGRTIYVRILNPNDQPVLSNGATFQYEGAILQSTIAKAVEYGGEDLSVTLYWNINETLLSGTYRLHFFADGEMIGSTSLVL